MTGRPVIAARSRNVKAPPSRLAKRSSSLVSGGSQDRRRTNVSWRLAGVTPAATSATPASIRSRPSSSRERSSSVTNNGLPAVARSRSRSPSPGAAPVSAAGQGVHVDLVERAEADMGTEPVTDTLDQPVERGRAGRRPQRPDHTEPGDTGPSDERRQHRERQVVGPVQVLGGEQHRLRSGHLLDQVDTRLDDRVAEVLATSPPGSVAR